MPERPALVITNTTPIIALVLIDHLDILQRLYGNIMMNGWPVAMPGDWA